MSASASPAWRRLPLRRPTSLLAALAFGSAMAAMPAVAQSGATPPAPPPPMPMRYAAAVQGDVARIQVYQPRGGRGTGMLVWTTPDSLGLQRARQRDTVGIARDNIARLEVQRGGQRRSGGAIVAGVTAGGLIGGLLGSVLGIVAECGDDCEGLEGLAGFFVGGTLGIVVGGVGGGVLGARSTGPQWVTIAP